MVVDEVLSTGQVTCVVGVLCWSELRYGIGDGVYGSGVDGGRIMPWQCGTMYLELVQKRDFSFLFFSFIIILCW